MLGVYRRGVTDQSESPGHESHRSFVPSFVGSCAQVDEFARPYVSLSLSFSLDEEPGIASEARIERIRNSRERIRASGPPFSPPARRVDTYAIALRERIG